MAKARFFINSGIQFLSRFKLVLKVTNHEKHKKNNDVLRCLLFRDLIFLIKFRSQIHMLFRTSCISLFFEIYDKHLDLGTPSKSSGRQHGPEIDRVGPKGENKPNQDKYSERPWNDPAFHETIVITVPFGPTGFLTTFVRWKLAHILLMFFCFSVCYVFI